MAIARHLRITQREKFDRQTWNRRLSKAGAGNLAGKPGRKGSRPDAIPPDPALQHLQAYRIRKDRSANGYYTSNKFNDEEGQEPVLWVQDTRTGERVTDPAILTAVLEVANSARKWVHTPKTLETYGGPGDLLAHNLGLECDCGSCPEPREAKVEAELSEAEIAEMELSFAPRPSKPDEERLKRLRQWYAERAEREARDF